MIGNGAQYLTAAGFGRYRITAASLGRGWVMCPWLLSPSAKQAIMDAFGVDGPAVIAATNEYLNGIAAQGQAGQAKATALAALINEDPMMVCSLPLTISITMPIRGIKGATANTIIWVETNYSIQATDFKLKAYLTMDNIDWACLWSIGKEWNETGSFMASYQSANKTQWWCNASKTSGWSGKSINKVANKWIWFEQNYNGIVQDGTTTSLPCNTLPSGTMKILASSGQLTKEWVFEDNGAVVRHYVPSKQNGVNGLVDLVTCQFVAPYIGSFTIPDISYTPTP